MSSATAQSMSATMQINSIEKLQTLQPPHQPTAAVAPVAAVINTPPTSPSPLPRAAFVIYHEAHALNLRMRQPAAAENSNSSSNNQCNGSLLTAAAIRLCALNDQLLLVLNCEQQLLLAQRQNSALLLQELRADIIDVDYCSSSRTLYVVNASGDVYSQQLNIVMEEEHEFDLNQLLKPSHWQPLSFDPLELCEDGIRIARVRCSTHGVLFVTRTNELYVLGSCGDMFPASAAAQEPQHLRLYEQRSRVLDVAAGEQHFALLLQQSAATAAAECNELFSSNAASTSQRSNMHHNRRASPQSLVATDMNNKHGPTHTRNSSTSSRSSRGSHNNNNTSHNNNNNEAEILQQLLYNGHALLHTQVATFGAANSGLLGTGDHIKRSAASSLQKLADIGICAIAAGAEHSIARTLDGRLFHWGRNTRAQLSDNAACQDISAPTELRLDAAQLSASEQTALAACCGAYQTLRLTVHGKMLTLRNELLTFQTVKCEQSPQLAQQSMHALPLILASGSYTLQNQRRPLQTHCLTQLQSLQQQLQSMLQQRNALLSLQHSLVATAAPLKQLLLPLTQLYMQLLYVLVAALHSLDAYYRGDVAQPQALLFVQHFEVMISLCAQYSQRYCDARSINALAEAAKIYASPSAQQDHYERLFQQPLQFCPTLVQSLESLMATRVMAAAEVSAALLAWQCYARQQRIALELAEHTQEFWLRNERNIKLRPLRRAQRRVLLSSEAAPLRISTSSRPNFLSNTQPAFILFSDCLCQLSGQLQTFPLVALWLQLDGAGATAAAEKSLRFTTPELQFTLLARTPHDRMLWHDQLQSAIGAALGLAPQTPPGSVRTMAYVFSAKHMKYAGVDAYGQWRNGLLHGNCYLQFPDDRFYLGEMRRGEIEGYGKMLIPSVGFYEGQFARGRFNGAGTYELKDNEVYAGHFRDGLFHGHGMLRTNTYTYVGEFQTHSKCGYGILDDALSGDKYMGMFADNKRTGAGTCITMNGDYFEGIFAHDELAGQGIAVFENDYVYEGELTLRGPKGKGTYYMPQSGGAAALEAEHSNLSNDDDDSAKRLLRGNILSGHLAGSWHDVSVVAGTVSVNRQFPKYPKSIGDLVVDNTRKWRSLFDNFEEEVLGVTHTTESIGSASTKELWNRIAVYINKQRKRDKTREQQDSAYQSYVHSYFARNISMGFSASMDKLSLKSGNSLMTNAKSSILDLSDDALRLHPTAAAATALQRTPSQETLYDCEQSDLDFMNSTTFPNNNEEHAFHNLLNSQLGSWANDSGSSLRSSFDSVMNLSGAGNNSSRNTSLDVVPSFGISTLNAEDVAAIKEYLVQAFKDAHHPLQLLNQRIANCFYTSYGCWKVKPTPILAKQAMREWESISKRVYKFVRKMFPALPEDYCVIESTREVVSHITLLYPIVLSEGIYSTLFVLYANKYSGKDEMYQQNLLFAEKQSDDELSALLGLDSVLLPVVNNEHFHIAIQTLKQLQEKYSPKAMLTVIEKCMQLISEAHKLAECENTVILGGDIMMPLTLFLVLRAAVPHLGAELALLDDLTGGSNFQLEMNGYAGYCYTTLKAAYEHITSSALKKT